MILGISGSPRDQATEYVLNEALKMLKEKGFETQFWSVRGKWVDFCAHCDYCLNNKECIVQDDVQDLYALLSEAKGYIFASPVYNGGVSAQIKAIMDRTRALIAEDKNVFKGKVGMGIVVGGDRNGGQEFALMQIHSFYIINGIVPVGGGYFGANLGATFWSKDSLEGVKADEEGFRSLKKTVKKFAASLELAGEKPKEKSNE